MDDPFIIDDGDCRPDGPTHELTGRLQPCARCGGLVYWPIGVGTDSPVTSRTCLTCLRTMNGDNDMAGEEIRAAGRAAFDAMYPSELNKINKPISPCQKLYLSGEEKNDTAFHLSTTPDRSTSFPLHNPSL